MKRWGALGLVVGVLAFGAGCSRDGLRPGEARLTFTGQVLLGEAGKALQAVTGERRIHDGDRVKVVAGEARIATASGVVYELRRTDFLLSSSPTLTAGELLVQSPKREVRVRSAGSEVLVRGAARLSRSLALTAGVYEGRAVLRSGGRDFALPALRQAAVPAIGVLPTAATPVAYDDGDTWDRRFLGAAMAFGRELEARSRAFGPNVARGEGRTPGFYRLLLPELEEETGFTASLLTPSRPPGETLVGATLAVSGESGSFAERWRGIFGFRDEGAPWGLVALDQGVSDAADPVLRRLDTAIGRAPLRFSGGTTALGPTTATTAAPAGGGSSGGGGGGGGGGSRPTTTTTQPGPTTTQPGPGPTTPTTQPPVTVPPPVTGTPVEPLVEPVVDTLNGLLP
jgi:hypothetical protein